MAASDKSGKKMKRANRFLVPANWQVLFKDMDISLEEALAYANLPPALFSQQKIYLSPAQYFQLWHGIEAASNGAELPLKFAQAMTLESFDVPIYAAICSRNLNAALERLKEYKPLIGPMLLDISKTTKITTATISCYGYADALPKCYALSEAVFFTQLSRLATRKRIVPRAVTLPALPDKVKPYEDYFGCPLSVSSETSISFDANDANQPFLTSNQDMLNFFDTELQQRLKSVLAYSSTRERVTTELIKLLPQGESSIELVAQRLAMSKRSLQRKLSEEKVSFKGLLQEVRQELADYYLSKTNMPMIEIAFLLGFQESNSFARAYHTWTGNTPSTKRSL
jgi:AraC-like DNA-binding protein